MSKRRSKAASLSARKPKTDGQGLSKNSILAIILTLILPPVGLLCLWKSSRLAIRGRALISGIAMIEMIVLTVLLLPDPQARTVMPVPVAPQRVTAAPEGEVLTALSNIDQILREQQAANGADGTPVPSTAEQLAAEQAQRAEILATKVYSVYSGARFYHAVTVCGNQSNRRELTVEEALAEGMGACPDCNPPQVGLAPGIVAGE